MFLVVTNVNIFFARCNFIIVYLLLLKTESLDNAILAF